MSMHLMNQDPIIKIFHNNLLPHMDVQLSDCANFEMRMADCLEAYGMIKGRSKCQDYIADLRECLLKGKQQQRVILMRKEHVRQYKNGERKTEFSKTPAFDAY